MGLTFKFEKTKTTGGKRALLGGMGLGWDGEVHLQAKDVDRKVSLRGSALGRVHSASSELRKIKVSSQLHLHMCLVLMEGV